MTDTDIQKSREERLAIDRAAKKPVGMLIGTSLIWLLIGSFSPSGRRSNCTIRDSWRTPTG